ncbi:MAG: CBS domain-containing protein [Gammaproteobacteria bacterium]|nr:CBS domain-containing protein [Gammaproteobacteria bacterium]
MLVSDYMSAAPVTVRSNEDYGRAAAIMDERDMHHLPVLDADDQVVGIVTKRDLQLAARFYREAPVEISEVMHTPVLTINENAPLASAVQQMNEKRIGCLPVLGADDKVSGILTETDLLRALSDLLKA